jgi:hypothetical protein
VLAFDLEATRQELHNSPKPHLVCSALDSCRADAIERHSA